MNTELFLDRWEQEKQRLAELGRPWSMEDAYRFSVRMTRIRRGLVDERADSPSVSGIRLYPREQSLHRSV